jgi:hypothetical protein
MNKKKFAITFAAVLVTVFVSNFVIHQLWLKEAYLATASMWRPHAEFPNFMCYMFGGQALVALFFSWIFIHGYKGGGIKEGVRFGLLMGGFQTGGILINYAVSPLPCSLACSWIAAAFIQSVLVGVVASLTYKS